MHGEDFEDLPQHEPDSLLLLAIKDFVCSQDVSTWDTFLVHDLQRFLDIVETRLFGSRGCIQAGEVKVGHMELEDVAEKHARLQVFDQVIDSKLRVPNFVRVDPAHDENLLEHRKFFI